jgi:phosphoenolpyruvate carboxykinase (ATP)
MSRIESVKDALLSLGIQESGELFYNPDYDLLIAHETSPELTGAARGVMTESGAVAVDTGIFTGLAARQIYCQGRSDARHRLVGRLRPWPQRQ